MFSESPFHFFAKIPVDSEVIFVADYFANDLIGGAELTTEALASAVESDAKIAKIRSRELTQQLLEQHAKKWWIICNFSEIAPNLLPVISMNLKYSLIEYDYKYCKFRSPEKHALQEGACDCHLKDHGKFICEFFKNADQIFWMSEKQRDKYFSLFPKLENSQNIVLSSVFDKNTLNVLKSLSESYTLPIKKDWVTLKSSSWVKGSEQAEDYCKNNNFQFESLGNLQYHQLLTKLAKAEGFVYLPAGSDTCPRMVIEAKLLGCKLILNENVQHKDEPWFATENLEEIFQYLSEAPSRFWNAVNAKRLKRTTISGYTTTYNCISQKYPFEQCIQSMLNFCDEVVVVDGGSVDGTYEALLRLAKEQELKDLPLKLKIHQIKRDWNHPRFAVFDGLQKAEARNLCSSDFCWQMDSDEIVHEDHYSKVRDLAETFPKNIDILSLPVIEYWGCENKTRMDITSWKWRISRNKQNITHGIPASLRAIDKNGDLYALSGTDGCDMIDRETHEPLSHLGFMSDEANSARIAALQGNEQARLAYENWFNQVVENLPCVFHFSWFDLERKIKTYKNYWTKHWESLRGEIYTDTAESNMFFDLPWSEVTDEMISQRAKQLSEIGGWIWHQKWKGQKTPWIKIKKQMPKTMMTFF